MSNVVITPYLNSYQASAIAAMLGRRDVPYGYRDALQATVQSVGARTHKHIGPIDAVCDRIDAALRGGASALKELTFTPDEVAVIEQAFVWVSKDDIASDLLARIGVATGSSSRMRQEQFRMRYGITGQHADLLRTSLRLESSIVQRLAEQFDDVDLRVYENLYTGQELRREWPASYIPTTEPYLNPVMALFHDTLAIAAGRNELSGFQGNRHRVIDAHDLELLASLERAASHR